MESSKGKDRILKMAKNKSKNNRLENLSSDLIKPSFFARFRFNLEELLEYLKSCSGRKFVDIPQVFQSLDDLGYWKFVRESQIFTFTNELELMIINQFKKLNESFDYHPSDVLIWGDLSIKSEERYIVKVIEKIVDDNQELFRVEIVNSGASILVSRYELDFWNCVGGSLPMDSLIEVIDWSNDNFWHKKLNDFKLYMIKKNFNFNFMSSEEEFYSQQNDLISEINSFFALNKENLVQRGRGIGLLSCGSGSNEDQLIVLTFAMQALALPFGVISRLWGKMLAFDYVPTHLSIISKRKTMPSSLDFMSLAIKNFDIRPIQRPLSEVLKRVLAKGPFGKRESLVYVKPQKNVENENDSIEKMESEI